MPHRLYSSHKDNLNYPTWCPGYTPVDKMLFYPAFYIPEAPHIALVINPTHPIPPPLYIPADPISPMDFICEDP